MLTVLVVMLCAAVMMTCFEHIGVLPVSNETLSMPRVTIDAGHGDFDGGASAPDGTLEKTLNMEIARPLGDILRLYGFDVTMTREDDSGLHEDDNASIREKKVSDMNARLALYEQADLNIAVHQNTFGDSRYSGTQLFYSDNHPLSKPLASHIRETVYSQLQPDNTRELKTGNRDIYLLYKTTKPTVLVECGFLSNAAELANLKDNMYQCRLAVCIANGAAEYAVRYIVKEERYS